jgi:hypothetical protein
MEPAEQVQEINEEAPKTEAVIEEVAELDSWDAEGVEESGETEGSLESFDDDGISDSEESVESAEADSEPNSDGDSESDSDSESEESESEPEAKEENSLALPEELQKKGLVAEGDKLGKMIKIDGEEQFVSLEDLGNDYSGQKAIAKRFSEYDRKEKEFKQEIQEINTYVNDLGKTMREVSMLDGVAKIAELTGIAPYQAKQALIKELMPEISRLSELSDQERELELKQEELNYKEKKIESESKLSAAKQAQVDLQNIVEQTRETHNISEDEWNEAYKYLDTHLPKEEQLTVQLVVDKVTHARAMDKTESVLGSFDDGKYAENDEVFDSLTEILMDNPDFTDEDINTLLTQAYGKAEKQEAQKEVAQALEAKNGKPKAQNPDPLAEVEAIEDWDDL